MRDSSSSLLVGLAWEVDSLGRRSRRVHLDLIQRGPEELEGVASEGRLSAKSYSRGVYPTLASLLYNSLQVPS